MRANPRGRARCGHTMSQQIIGSLGVSCGALFRGVSDEPDDAEKRWYLVHGQLSAIR